MTKDQIVVNNKNKLLTLDLFLDLRTDDNYARFKTGYMCFFTSNKISTDALNVIYESEIFNK